MTTNIDFEKMNLTTAKILVLGDVMLDQYWHGGSTRISPEAPVPVVKINKTDNRLGGAANVALNLVTLGCTVKLLGICGQDSAAGLLEKLLSEKKISNSLVASEKYSTIVKLRVLCRHQQMIRLDHEDDPDLIDQNDMKLLQDLFAHEISNYNAVILSDYAKGVLINPQPFIQAVKALGIPVIIDPKNENFAVYKNATLVKPNLAEFESVVGKCKNLEILEEKARNLMHAHQIESLLITRGSQGMSYIPADKPAVHMPAYGGEVYDVTGAGDTVIAVLTACMAAKIDMLQAVHLTTIAAGIVVGKVGTSTVTMHELQQSLGKQKELPQGVADEQTLIRIIKLCQARGEKVVFVNGCYDLLHYGHINYLEQARALGDRLVIGVNTDESVRELKGPTRPMYNLQQRMTVLAALKSVDWVVPFAEPTPGRLVEALTPDILVKGDEHFSSIDQIPASEGAHHVLKHGGTLHLIARTPECSSTKMIEFMAEE